MTIPYLSGDGHNGQLNGEHRAERFPLGQREILLIVGFWTLLAVITELNRLIDPRGPGPQLTFRTAPTMLAFVKSLAWTLLTPPLFAAAGELVGRRVLRPARFAMLAGTGLVAAIIVSLTMNAAFALLAPAGQRNPPLWQVGGFGFLNDLIIAIGVIAAGLARAYFLHLRTRQEQAMRLQAQLAEARLDALRRQLDPHFLFNTLHAISSLVERDPRGVRRMISRLSELLRHSFDSSVRPEVTLREELEFLARYVEILQVRFQGRLEVRVDVQERVEGALVPNLILQPLVENAIRHGVEKRSAQGVIAIEGRLEGDELVLRVRDNGPGPDAGPAVVGHGVGMRNTVARLEQLYGTSQRFSLTRDVGWTVAEIRLPYRAPAELHTAGVPVLADEEAVRA